MSNTPTKDYIPPYPLNYRRFVKMPVSFRKPYGFLTERSYPKLHEEIEWNDLKMMRRIERDLKGETSAEKIQEYIDEKLGDVIGLAMVNFTLSLFFLMIDVTITDAQIRDALWDIYTIDPTWILDVRKKMTDLRTLYDSMQEKSKTALYEKFLEEIGAATDDDEKADQLIRAMNRMVSGLNKTLPDGEFVSTYSHTECKNAYKAEFGYPAFSRDEDGEFQISNFNLIKEGVYTGWENGVCIGNHPQEQTYFVCESQGHVCKKGEKPQTTALMEWDWDTQKCKIRDEYCGWKGLEVDKHHTYTKNGKTIKSAECKNTTLTDVCREHQGWFNWIFLTTVPVGGLPAVAGVSLYMAGAFGKMYCNLGEDTTVCGDADVPITDPKKNPNYSPSLHG